MGRIDIKAGATLTSHAIPLKLLPRRSYYIPQSIAWGETMVQSNNLGRPPESDSDYLDRRSHSVPSMQDHSWYHVIELPEGKTAGQFDWEPYKSHFFSIDFAQKSVIDIGAGNGFFSFEMEKLGAVVTSTDIPSQDQRDNNTLGAKNLNSPQGYPHHFPDAYWYAHAQLKSNAKHILVNVYELARHPEAYDVVFCSDLLLHLSDPFRALHCFRAVCKGRLIVMTPLARFDEHLSELLKDKPVAEFLGSGGNNAFWLPSQKCIEEMVTGAGFTIESSKTFKPSKTHCRYDGVRCVIVASI